MESEVGSRDKNLEEEFLRLLQDERLLRLFRDFLKESHSYENLAFWLEAERHKQIPSSNNALLISSALHIYQTYIKKESENEINITSKERNDMDLIIANNCIHPHMVSFIFFPFYRSDTR
jgi:hypothetical protein